MALQESNCPDTLADLNVVLGCKYTKIQFNLSVNHRQQHHINLPNQSSGYYSSDPDVDLDLKFYIDQSAPLSKEDLFTGIENKLCDMLRAVDGVFTHRSVQPYGETKAMIVSYSVKLRDYDHFVGKVSQLARLQSDREFVKVLEAKLIED